MKIKAVIETTRDDQLGLICREAPVTASFVNLSINNFYDGLKFHRVISNYDSWLLPRLERVALDIDSKMSLIRILVMMSWNLI